MMMRLSFLLLACFAIASLLVPSGQGIQNAHFLLPLLQGSLTSVSLLAAFNGGCEGYAVRFDGTNWLDAGHGAWSQPKDYTLEFWIKPYLTQPNSLAVLGNFLRMGAFPHRLQCWIANPRLVSSSADHFNSVWPAITCARRFLLC